MSGAEAEINVRDTCLTTERKKFPMKRRKKKQSRTLEETRLISGKREKKGIDVDHARGLETMPAFRRRSGKRTSLPL